jgi:arylsulfatase A-like enzyme
MLSLHPRAPLWGPSCGQWLDDAATVNMEDVDPELVRRSLDFIDRSVAADTPFFLWHSSTRCQVWTHLTPKWQGKSGFGLYADAMMELDWVGQILDKLDELGIADDTIVLFTSDDGAEVFIWPDGGTIRSAARRGSTYEGGFRVPMVARWLGVIKSGTIVNEIMAHEDWLPTLLAAAAIPTGTCAACQIVDRPGRPEGCRDGEVRLTGAPRPVDLLGVEGPARNSCEDFLDRYQELRPFACVERFPVTE